MVEFKFNPDARIEKMDQPQTKELSFNPDMRLEDLTKNRIDSMDWENMSIDDKKEFLNDVGNMIANKLELNEVPKIEYYEGPSNEFGYYSVKEDKVYLNTENMNNLKEMIDTLAHEFRHKYQEIRANLPKNVQNSQDKEFKENIDDYIDSYDNYKAYKYQFIEADARIFASEFIKEFLGGTKYGGESVE